MSRPKEIRVFILGAGCSIECGYPPGAGLKTELEKFLNHTGGKAPNVYQSVTDTIKLLGALPDIETLDQLARHCDESVDAWTRQHGPIIENEAEFGKRKR